MNHNDEPEFFEWPNETRAWMDYLHGDATDDEYEAACHYEYARESAILREAAALRKLRRQGKNLGEVKYENVSVSFPQSLDAGVMREIAEKRKCSAWFNQDWKGAMWKCSSFPNLPWNQLGEGERKIILLTFPLAKVQPLFMHRVADLGALGIFDKFNVKAKKAEELLDELPDVWPVITQGQQMHAMFTIDLGKTKKRLMEEFGEWLDLPENRERLETFGIDPTGTTGTHKDRLKDLAVWRLYKKFGYDELLKFTDKNRKRFHAPAKIRGVQYSKGEKRPFHDARQGQSSKVPLNEAPLCSEPSFCLKAKQRVEEYLAQIIPCEFGTGSLSPQK